MTEGEITTPIQSLFIAPDSSIRAAMAAIDRGARRLALVVEGDSRLLALVTDGDIRRGLLRGLTLDDSVNAVMQRQPMTIPYLEGRAAARRMMREHGLHHLPRLDGQGRVIDVAWINDVAGFQPRVNRVVLMAGGLGLRLRPLTETTPKPMLKVGERPLLETIIRNFADQGFRNFTITLNYLGDVIRRHFGDGSAMGVAIDYVEEPDRLGTCGALSLIDPWPDAPMIVMNGDILTRTDFDSLLHFHLETGATATMGAREFCMQIPYGVIETEGTRLVGMSEKPTERYFVNAGIYVLSPEAAAHLSSGKPLDMPDLFQRIMAAGGTASVYPIRDYWMDIGRLEDLERADAEFRAIFAT